MFQDWEECREMMILRFKPPIHVRMETFVGQGDPRKHMAAWMEVWCEMTMDELVHFFIHTLGQISTPWYLDAKLHQCTHHWETMKDDFVGTFGLIGGTGALDEAL